MSESRQIEVVIQGTAVDLELAFSQAVDHIDEWLAMFAMFALESQAAEMEASDLAEFDNRARDWLLRP